MLKGPSTKFQLSKSISSNNDQNFLLDIPPRVGKSLIAIELVKKWNKFPILILSGANSTNAQWKENLEKYNPHIQYEIYCYQSLHKLRRNAYKVILLDEFDLVTEQRLSQLQEFTAEHWIGMSGTLEEADLYKFRSLTKKYKHVRISIEQAIEWDLLPAPLIYKVKLQLDNKNRNMLFYKGKDKKKKSNIVPYPDRWTAYKDKKKNTIIQCTEWEYNLLINEEFERWKQYEEEFNLPIEERSSTVRFLVERGFTKTICNQKKLKVGNERKQFYANIKNRHFKKLFSLLPAHSRTLVFCNDIAQSNILNEEFSINSKKPGSMGLIESFNNREIDLLFSVKILERGVDFVDVDYLVILQSSGAQSFQIQRAFRIMMSKTPKIILLYYPNTRDEEYINKFLTNFKSEWIIEKVL